MNKLLKGTLKAGCCIDDFNVVGETVDEYQTTAEKLPQRLTEYNIMSKEKTGNF